MRWWVWLILVLGLFVALAVTALISFRRRVRREFIAFLGEAYPQFEVVGVRGSTLELKTPSGAIGALNLTRLYSAAAEVKGSDAAAHRPIYEQFASSLLADVEEQTRPLDPAKDLDRVMPRLVTRGFVDHVSKQTETPHRPLGNSGLFVAYVLDHSQRVMYLTRKHVDELRLTDDQLHEQALANLRKKGGGEKIVRGAVEQRQLALVKAGDTYDAARLLLVPEHLRDGEGLVAAVPDRDTLALVSLPREDARKVPMTPDNRDHLLLNRPLWVTKDGIELA